MSQWQVVSILLPATTACVCKLSPRNLPSICPTLARKTEECKFQYDPQNAEIGFAFICLRVSAEEWQGVTATNNVCGDYLPFATTLLLTTITQDATQHHYPTTPPTPTSLPPATFQEAPSPPNSINVPALFDSKTRPPPTMTLLPFFASNLKWILYTLRPLSMSKYFWPQKFHKFCFSLLTRLSLHSLQVKCCNF